MSFLSRSLLLAGLAVGLALPAAAQVQLQVIHNAADPAAAEVDVYVNGALTLDDFAFRTATPFLDLPANTDLAVAIAPGTSASADDAVFNQTYNLPDGAYQLIANGVLSPGDFAANPDGADIGFQLIAGLNAHTASPASGQVDIRVVHGATDAPTVDVNTRGTHLANDISYGAVSPYLQFAPEPYTLEVTLAGGAPVAQFSADLSGASGKSLTVLASGFLDPSANQNGAAFGLLAVFADGATAVLGPPPGPARLQVIHNAADPGASVVDVYVNDDLLLDDFAFRTATPFIDVPSGTALEVAVAPGTSTSSADAVFTQSYTLDADAAYQLIANGVLSPDDFAANPDGVAIGFQLLVGADALEASPEGDEVSVRVVHGATDAPTVDVRTGGAVLVDDASYTDVTGYLQVAPGVYPLDITLADGTPVATFLGDLSGAGGAAVTVLASGFLTPSANQDGAAFGLLGVFADGTTALLPQAAQNARLQVIHNAADPAAAEVDVYVNDVLLLDDFAFRTATPFITVSANTPLDVAVAPGTSSSSADAVFTETYTLPGGSTTQLIANGVLSPADFAANPDGIATAFQLLVGADALEDGDGGVAVRVVHGASDAPTVDVRTGGTVLVDDASYTDVTGYLTVPPADYVLDITLADGTPVASFTAPLTVPADTAVTVLASGFLTPSANQGGEAFGLLAVFPDGNAVLLPTAVDAAGAPGAETLALSTPAPNPLRGTGTVAFSLDAPGAARLALYDALGREVAVLADGEYSADLHQARVDTRALASGVYVMRLVTPTGVRAQTMTVVR